MSTVDWLPKGWGRNLKGDIFGGITSAVVALPLALAFGVASGAGAAAGLYSAIFCGIIASLFGGSPAQVSGPTGGMTVVLVMVYKELGVEGLFLAMFMAGLIQIALSLFKIGKYIHFIPHPVIAGFTNGIAILIFSQQLATLKATNGVLNWAAIGLALAVVAIMFIWPRISKVVPGSLVALIGTSVAAAFFLTGRVDVIGEIPRGLPMPHLGFFLTQWPHTLQVLKPAIMLALLGAIESLLSAVVVDELAGTRHNSDKELFGQGLGNAVASLFGGLAGTGAIVRSAVNVRAGGRTSLSGAFHGVLILLVTISLGKYAALVPQATLAGILMVTAIGMVDWESVKDLRRAPLADSAVMLVTAGLTVFTDLVTAVSVGVVLSMALFTGKMSLSPVRTNNAGSAHAITPHGPLFFGVAKRFLDEVEAAGAAVQLWDLSQVPSIDATGAVVLRKAYRRASEQGARVFLVGMQEPVRGVLERFGLLAELEEGTLCDSAVEVLEKISLPAAAAPAPAGGAD
jgi:sulfate permease, SulP family